MHKGIVTKCLWQHLKFKSSLFVQFWWNFYISLFMMSLCNMKWVSYWTQEANEQWFTKVPVSIHFVHVGQFKLFLFKVSEMNGHFAVPLKPTVSPTCLCLLWKHHWSFTLICCPKLLSNRQQGDGRTDRSSHTGGWRLPLHSGRHKQWPGQSIGIEVHQWGSIWKLQEYKFTCLVPYLIIYSEDASVGGLCCQAKTLMQRDYHLCY